MKIFAAFIGVLLSSVASATTLQLEVEIPRLSVAEYHRPYVAVWIADERQQRVVDLSVWYDTAMQDNEGEQWLKDLRQWWRRSGRTLTMPVDGVSGATRAPGTHTLHFHSDRYAEELEPGQYSLVIEAAREVGGRELLQIPFNWPLDEAYSASAEGEHELGTVTLSLNP